MKTLAIILLFIPVLAFSQERTIAQKQRNVPPYDTIWVTMTPREVKIITEKGVDAANEATIGSKDFGSMIKGAIIILKATNKNARPSSLFILHGDEIYNGVIAYDSTLVKADESIDWRKPKKIEEPITETTNVQDLTPKVDTKVIGNIGKLEGKEKDRFSRIATVGEKLIFKLADIMQDEKYLYVKLGVYNESKELYNIADVDFIYKNTDDARDYKQVQDPDEISNGVTSVPAKGNKNLVIAFPKFEVTSKWELKVTLKQKDGSRNISVSIPFKEIKEATKFD